MRNFSTNSARGGREFRSGPSIDRCQARRASNVAIRVANLVRRSGCPAAGSPFSAARVRVDAESVMQRSPGLPDLLSDNPGNHQSRHVNPERVLQRATGYECLGQTSWSPLVPGLWSDRRGFAESFQGSRAFLTGIQGWPTGVGQPWAALHNAFSVDGAGCARELKCGCRLSFRHCAPSRSGRRHSLPDILR